MPIDTQSITWEEVDRLVGFLPSPSLLYAAASSEEASFRSEVYLY